jgi:hypothetical protein
MRLQTQIVLRIRGGAEPVGVNVPLSHSSHRLKTPKGFDEVELQELANYPVV